MIRRTMVLGAAFTLPLWAAVAGAQTYTSTTTTQPGGTTTTQPGGTTTTQPGGSLIITSPPGGGTIQMAAPAQQQGGGFLSRTGASHIAPLVQGGTVLIGAGAMLIYVVRRRRTSP